ncbi:MAG: AAA family ATPase, partial [Desulfuromonadales bacterium]|nr:AAA family ATPase [Desulfuromonadales bacterium]
EMMLNTARNAGLTAVYGEVGCGKSVICKAVVEQLQKEDIRVIFPVIVDKKRITPSGLIDAVIMDLTESMPRWSLEQKTRQALTALKNRAATGMKQVLIIEEAHLLTVETMKALKQIYELESGFTKLVGIILIGQTELSDLMDESEHPEIREVIRRTTTAEIVGLNGDLEGYLAHKFKRVGKNVGDVLADDAFAALQKRMSVQIGGGTVEVRSYPLTVNNYVARAMNMAAQHSEPLVTAEVILEM